MRDEQLRLEKERREKEEKALKTQSRISLMKQIAKETGYEVEKVEEDN